MERLKGELETSQQDCKTKGSLYSKTPEQQTNTLSVSLVDNDECTVLNEVKNRQTNELIHVQKENKALRKKLLNVEADFASHRKVFQSNIGNQNPPTNQSYSEEIMKTINSIKDAVTTRPTHSVEDFEKNITALGETVLQSNAALAKSEEVFKNSNKASQAPSIKGSQPVLSFSSQQHPNKPKTQNLASKFSSVFNKGKANSNPSTTAHQEADNRNSRDADHFTASSRPETTLPSIPASPHFSSKDSK